MLGKFTEVGYEYSALAKCARCKQYVNVNMMKQHLNDDHPLIITDTDGTKKQVIVKQMIFPKDLFPSYEE